MGRTKENHAGGTIRKGFRSERKKAQKKGAGSQKKLPVKYQGKDKE